MNDDDLTTDLGRELHGRSDAMHGSSLALADVKQRARSIRRRRAAIAVGGAVAAVALIVPTAAIASHQGHRTSPMPPATQTVTPSPTPSAGHQPPPGVLDVSDLPTGAAPRMDYVYQGTLHFTDGSTGTVDTRYPPSQFVEMADGSRVWQTTDQGTPYIEIQDTDGTFHDPVPSSWGLSVNRPHSIVAWLTPSGQVTIWEGWSSEPRPLGDPVPGSEWHLGPVTGAGQAAPGHAGPSCRASTCTVIVTVPGSAWQPWEISDSGTQRLLNGSYRTITDVSEAGLTLGYYRMTDVNNCSRLLGGGEFQGFSTCRHTLESFSPDGQLMLGLPSFPDGAGSNRIAMYDLDGTRLFDRGSTEKVQPTFNAQVWEDDSHVLIPVYQEGRWSLVRIASDGSLEYAVPPRPGVDVTENPYVVPTGGQVSAG